MTDPRVEDAGVHGGFGDTLIPCCRPLLPAASALLPYLRQADASRWYTNFGPLVERFEQRLAEHFGVDPDHVVTVANATLGLSIALARVTEPGGLCLMPSWTFAATAHAAQAVGLQPYFLDVDPQSWATTPAIVERALATLTAPVAAVVAVAPFGAPIDVESWAAFESKLEIPVVLDMAAAFAHARVGPMASVVSLHTTKLFGVGEGGCILATDAGLKRDVQRRSNFGFYEARSAEVRAFNAKLSEYHAAVGLAGFDAWPTTRERAMGQAARYRKALADLPGVRMLPGFGTEWVSNTCMVNVEMLDATRVARELLAKGIEARRWWGSGCHGQPAFVTCGRTNLDETERLANHVLGLPFYPDLTEPAIDYVAQTLGGIITSASR